MANFIKGTKITGGGSYTPINLPNGRSFANRKRPFDQVLFLDNFNDTPATLITAHTPDVGGSWSGSVQWVINGAGNQATSTGKFTYPPRTVSVDMGVSDYRIMTQWTTGGAAGSNRASGPVFRYQDSSNFFFLAMHQTSSSFFITEVVAGSPVVRATLAGLALNTTYNIEVVQNGDSITAVIQGVGTVGHSSSNLKTETRIGLAEVMEEENALCQYIEVHTL